MIRIVTELLEDRDPKSPTLHESCTVLVDSIPLENTYAFRLSRTSAFHIDSSDEGDSERILSQRLSDIPADVDTLEVTLEFLWSDLVSEVRVARLKESKGYELSFKFDFTFDKWKGPYSFAEYGEEFGRIIERERNPGITLTSEDDEGFINGFNVSMSFSHSDASIASEVERCSSLVRDLNEKTKRSLTQNRRIDSVVMYFDFPEVVKNACEQYLLYFVQFLQDLGIEATAELRQQVGEVLFAVTPTNVQGALDRIRLALEVYLQLPSSPISELFVTEDDIAIQRLTANIHHLKGQLALAVAMIQSKDATIRAQAFTIENQERLLNGEILVSSAKYWSPRADSEDKEELLGGALAITRYKGKAFEVNLPDLFRRLKRFLSNR